MSIKTLPRWDMTPIYPSLASDEFESDLNQLIENIGRLKALFDEHHIHPRPDAALDEATVSTFEAVLDAYGAVLSAHRTITSYLRSFITTDSRNALAREKFSVLQQASVQLQLLDTRWNAWLGSLDTAALAARSTMAQAHTHMLARAKVSADHLMSPAEEALAAQLNLSGSTAWSQLYAAFSSQLEVDVVLNGEAQTLPMSAVRNLGVEPDRAVRCAGYDAELAAWQRAEVPISAALNGVKGEANTLTRQRGWSSTLDVALFQNSIDRPTLEAMMTAAREAFPDFRRYLKAKARALGLDALAWYDLFAPLGQSGRWSYDEAEVFIVEQFGTFSEKMQWLARRAFAENWIDAEPRPGKRDGAFCMSLQGETSRILCNYRPSYGGVNTLAHELGHAYHNFNLAGCETEFQKSLPMTLAETASIFCETIVRNAALEVAETDEQLVILEASLQSACQVVVDITSRFLFESAVFERRRARELSAEEFNELMLDAQHQTYGDGLDLETLHPYMWAAKPHYYRSDLSYYNFPYMYGLLFALGLFAQYQDDPDAFVDRYDALLASSGKADAATLAQGFGIDVRAPEFWRASLDVIRGDIERFEELAGA